MSLVSEFLEEVYLRYFDYSYPGEDALREATRQTGRFLTALDNRIAHNLLSKYFELGVVPGEVVLNPMYTNPVSSSLVKYPGVVNISLVYYDVDEMKLNLSKLFFKITLQEQEFLLVEEFLKYYGSNQNR